MGPETAAGTAPTLAIVAARNEAGAIAATLGALRRVLPGAGLWVADDASEDGTAELAMQAGARVVSRGRPHGKGANVTAAAQAALQDCDDAAVVLLCDADLGESAGALARLVEAVRDGECDLAVASFARRVGGGLGIALGFSRWAIRRLCGAEPQAPISGQRALRAGTLRGLLPLADGFGMEVGMTVDAVRSGARLREYELQLTHRATGRSVAGFVHRARQLRDFFKAYRSRRASLPSN